VQRRGRRHHEFRKPREDAPADAVAAGNGAPREDKGGRRERFEGKGRDRDNDRRRDKFSGDRKDRDRGDRERGRDFRDKGGRDKGRESGPALRQYASSAPRERERAIDPNSPFAKLAALKEQLAGNRKD
jgi:ATP-dependent RNA helicase SUPV3L1/SUV3